MIMQTYRFHTRVSETGVISLPFPPALFNQNIELIVVPAVREKKKEQRYTASDFLKEWTGAFAGLAEENTDDVKFAYLMNKHK